MTTLFDPVRLGSLSLGCRLVRSATAERISMDAEGDGDRLGIFYEPLVRGGVGLIITGHMTVHPSGRHHARMAGIYTDRQRAEWRRAVERVHRAGGRIAAQINHAGGRAAATPAATVCVSPLPDRSPDPMRGTELTEKGIEELIAAFGTAARHARDIGFDAVQVHGAHGYLGSQFLSPLTNRRTDSWGGSMEGRARFLRHVVRAARSAVGPDYPLGMKLGALDSGPAGLTVDDTLAAAGWFVEDSLTFIEISGAFHAEIAARKVKPGKGEGYYLPLARQFKERLSIPVIAVGGLRSLETINSALTAGACDAVAMSRPLICEPDLAVRLRSGGKSACIGCNLCMLRNDDVTQCYAKIKERRPPA